jgi:hypothetical protein
MMQSRQQTSQHITQFAARLPQVGFSWSGCKSACTFERVPAPIYTFDLRSAANLKEFAGVISRFETPKEIKDLARPVGILGPFLVTKVGLLKKTLLTHNWRLYPSQYEPTGIWTPPPGATHLRLDSTSWQDIAALPKP